jgi:hypothetical protein
MCVMLCLGINDQSQYFVVAISCKEFTVTITDSTVRNYNKPSPLPERTSKRVQTRIKKANQQKEKP